MQQTKGKSDCFQLLNKREKAVVLVSITFVDIVLFSLFFFFFFAHSVIFLCKWMKWPNFSRFFCVEV